LSPIKIDLIHAFSSVVVPESPRLKSSAGVVASATPELGFGKFQIQASG
jgi:hypothetical protein